MARIRSQNNRSTELELIALFKKFKLSGWRRNRRLPGKPDFIFPRNRAAVFVDGCFWHGCPKCYRRPKSNQSYWDKKRTGNMARDKRVNRQLRQRGWRVIRIWQHSLEKNPDMCLSRIKRVLSKT